VLDEDAWIVGSSLMMNSLLGLAVGLCALALLLQPGKGAGYRLLGIFGLAALIGLKPQYFVSFGLLSGWAGLHRLVPDRWRSLGFSAIASRSGPWRWGPVLLLAALPYGVRLLALPDAVTVFLVPMVFAAILLGTPAPSPLPAADRGPALAISAVTALAVAIVFLMFLPSVPSTFGPPVWAPGHTGWNVAEHFSTVVVLFLATTLLLAPNDRIAGSPSAFSCLSLGRQIVVVIAVLAGVLHFVSFPVRGDLLAQGLELGGFQVDAFRDQRDLGQAWVPLRLLLVAACVGAAFGASSGKPLPWRPVIVAAVAMLACVRAATLVWPLLEPAKGYEAIEETDLRRTLEEIPVERSLLISSDIADPADDHGRPANGSYLSAYRGHAYWLSELRYVHWTRPDAVHRLDMLQRFFGSQWSQWHYDWLYAHGITHVLVSDRCVPVWSGEAGLPLRKIARDGNWTAFAVQDLRAPGAARPPTTWSELRPTFGRSECLALRRIAPDLVRPNPSSVTAR
jgi:hypothetical protein